MDENRYTKAMCARIFMGWLLRERTETIPMVSEMLDEKDPGCIHILQKRLDAWNIKINIPYDLAVLTTLCVDGNPGIYQMQMANLLESCQKKFKQNSNYLITPSDYTYFCMKYDNLGNFPICYPIFDDDNHPDEKVLKVWEDIWDGQKDENGKNLCDTKDWWMQKIYGVNPA